MKWQQQGCTNDTKLQLLSLQFRSRGTENDNINDRNLCKKGFHWNTKGKDRLALNFLNQIQKFWCSAERLNESPLSYKIILDTTLETSQLSDNPICNPPFSDNIDGFKQLINENPFRIILGHIKLSSVRDKFKSFADVASASLNVLIISQTKTDKAFLESWFIIEGFSEPYHLDRKVNGRGILLNVRENIPTKCSKRITVSNSFEGLFIKLSLKNKKWLLGRLYNVHRDKIISHVNTVSNILEKVWKGYENLILLGGFNAETEEKDMPNFMNMCNWKNLIKHQAYFKKTWKSVMYWSGSNRLPSKFSKK